MGFARLFRPRYARARRANTGAPIVLRCMKTAFYVVVAGYFVSEMLSVLTKTLQPLPQPKLRKNRLFAQDSSAGSRTDLQV
jgi:hypothetical protein